ncbi:hypothetical protein WR25_19778 [Diploscapter pachys]|uniref:MIF4G domain-containing protein n=1 Tax=Diploscapter pachys TaxID=2018661 RepID=A0A2A2L8C0_9BILA|nr:hypothetical protein WR25_19778 [Diploscapter pachys]
MIFFQFSRALKEGGLSIWPDDEAKVFYENLLDIRAIVPKNLYKESEVRTVPTEKMQDSVDAIDVDSVLSTSQQDVQPQDSSNFPSSSRENSPTPTSQIHEVVVDPSSFGTEEMKAKWQKFTLDLDHLVNKELADQAALFFVSNLNTKAYRKRLVKALLGVESSRMDILPFYARLICSLNNVMPDVTTEIINQLIQQFREFIQPIRKEFVRVEEKIKCCIFITELMKFGIIPRAEGLSCLRQLVYYFHGHLIDMAAAMIENGGMYMYRSTDCHSKMKQLLEVVQTKKERLKDERQIVLIETAYFACIPPEDGRRYKAKELPPMQLYIRNLILSINSKSVNETIQCLRKIDWVDPKVRGWAMYYLSSPWLLPYSQLHNLANAVSGLNAIQYHDWIGVQIIDNITETIRMSLEVPMVFNQFAVASVKYLGELYNYTVCENPIIFTTLYNLISFDIDQDIQSADFFRLHLTCELVVTVGDYFQKGHSKMDYFITYFQRYYWMKRNTWLQNAPMSEDMEQPTFPIDVEVEFKDCMKFMGKKNPPGSLKEANEKVEKMEAEFKNKMKNQEDVEDEDEPEHRRKSDDISNEEGGTTEDEVGDSGLSYCDDTDYGDNVVLKEDEKKEMDEDDEDFIREFDKMYTETHRNAPNAPPAQTTADLTLPATVKTKGKRIAFESHDDDDDTDTEEGDLKSGSQKPALKKVELDNEKLQEAWAREKEQEQMKKEELKRLTLGHSIRQQAEEDEQQYGNFKKHFENKRRRGGHS